MKRRNKTIAWFALILLANLTIAKEPKIVQKRKPNIVFILADDLGYGDVGLFGNKIIRTPHLDELGRNGIVLTQHYSASPLCAPARAALLTGRYNHRTGAVDVPSNLGLDRIALSERTMGDLFTSAGYATGMIGKWHNGLHDMRYHPNARGFKEFVGFLNGGMDYYRWVLDRNGTPEKSDGRYLTDVFTDEACKFIRRNRAKPFFLYLAYNAPHSPFLAPEDLVKRYRERGKLKEQVCQLYGMVERMDHGIGKVLKELKSQGLSNDTIVVFTSDNGPYMGGKLKRYNGKFRGMKGSVFEGGIRVPCMVSWPKVLPSGKKVGGMTHFCDWLPTLMSLAGCKPQKALKWDGCDISPLLRGKSDELDVKRFWQRNRYAPLTRCNGAMRDGPWKLVWPMRDGGDWKDKKDSESYRVGLTSAHRLMPISKELPERRIGPVGAPQLFRTDIDPAESKDLSSKHPERVANMVKAWDSWFLEVTDDWQTRYEKEGSSK